MQRRRLLAPPKRTTDEQRGRSVAPPASTHPVLGLQRLIGNAATVAYLQRSANDDERPSPVRRALGATGTALDRLTREAMEQHLGADLSTVRLHVDRSSARSVSAAAYTVGNDVVLDPDHYREGTDEGERMIAHELTHVVQQRRGPVEGKPAGGGVAVSDPGDRFEQEAERSADAYEHHTPFAVSSSPSGRSPAPGNNAPTVQRFPATVLSGPIEWDQYTNTSQVTRPEGGVSGGIYFFESTEENPDIKRLVVKPIFGFTDIVNKETPEQLQFGDKALSSLLGINAPVSRPVNKGAEFNELAAIIGDKGVPMVSTDDDGNEVSIPLTEAKSFIVMSEVPKARSISSLAQRAVSDPDKVETLFDAVFNEDFIAQIARISVGDLLIGNNDRLVNGKSNLGNVMVSVLNGKMSVHAIDTTAVLPKALKPSDVVDYGTFGGETLDNAIVENDDPATVVDHFYSAIREVMLARQGELPPLPEGAKPAWQALEEEFQQRRPAILDVFVSSWAQTLREVQQLVETKSGRNKLRKLTDEQKGTEGEDQLDYRALKTNALYLAGRARGLKHDEAKEEPAQFAAYAALRHFDLSRVQPFNDRFKPGAPGDFPSDAKNSELEFIGPPVERGVLNNLRSAHVKENPPDALLAGLLTNVETAKGAVSDQLGTKRRGLLRKQTTRNRVLASNYIFDGYLVLGGAYRMRWQQMQLVKAVELIDACGTTMDPTRLNKILTTLNTIVKAKDTVGDETAAFLASLDELIVNLGRFKQLPRAQEIQEQLTAARDLLATTPGKYKRLVGDRDLQHLVYALLVGA